MNTSSRFVVAIHVLVVLAADKKRALKSEFLAFSVNTNAVVIRRVLGLLRNAGLVNSVSGPDGGYRLNRDPDNINLLSIYQAVNEGDLFHLHYQAPNQGCPVGANIQECLSGIFEQASTALKNSLSNFNLGQLSSAIMDRSGVSDMTAAGISIEELQTNYIYSDGSFIKKK